MKVFHTFDNYADQDINVRTEGAIESVVTVQNGQRRSFLNRFRCQTLHCYIQQRFSGHIS